MSGLPSKRSLLDNVFKNGKSIRSKFFSFRFSKTNVKGPILTFVVSKKVAPKAVDRNKLKRQGRYIISKHNNKLSTDLVGVFVAQSPLAKAKLEDMEADLLDLLSKSGNLSK